jgi:hypothetical protein
MLWYKSWLDTRWRFFTGFVLLTCSAVGAVLAYPRLMQLVPLVPPIDTGGELGRRIKEGVELAREYRGYIWSSWFRQTPTELGTLFAVLLGSGGLLSQGFGGGELFTLSLPVSRNRLITVRAVAGLAELLVLALVPSLLIPFVSPAIGESYGVPSAFVHGVCLFVAGAVFFSLAVLLSTFFEDVWRPLLIALSIAIVVGLGESLFRDVSRYGIFGTMSGELYFRSGRLPWAGWLASATATALMLKGAAMNFARRDF